MALRVLTAAVGIPLLAFAALSESLWPVKVLAIFIFAFGSYEISRNEPDVPRWCSLLLAAAFVFCALLWQGDGSSVLAIGALTSNIVLWFEVLGDRGHGRGRAFGTAILQVAWLGFGSLLLIAIRSHDARSLDVFSLSNGSALMLTLLCVWAGDSAGYFVGKSMGKHKLAPVLSPKKTWEGSIGNFTTALLTGSLIGPYFGLNLVSSVAIGTTVGVLGQVGDLFQSAWKRSVDIKDSGSLLPGHGGVLDRFDSLIYSAPAVVLILQWLS
ncbi:MAG: phosphatidate cytidylyltransferase [Fimbriimonadales bacterium]|nr:phosphatidate cytidylyltransferase [Fimbriimonadales bacterium]